MRLKSTKIPGCFELKMFKHTDRRGAFVKAIHSSTLRKWGLECTFRESFYSVSHRGVLRGMHFQMPPADGAKLVYCLSGEVLDVALDLRVGSPSFGHAIRIVLTPEQPTALYIPSGVAHGFLTISGPATLVYNVEAEYFEDLDAGIRWDSFGMNWGVEQPIISDRDLSLPSFSSFRSPFRFAHTPDELSA